MKRNQPQCKDIPERPILEFLAGLGRSATWYSNEDGTPMGECSVLHAMPAGTPAKLALAKMRRMIEKGLVNGCGCGCRGDFGITEAGRRAIAP